MKAIVDRCERSALSGTGTSVAECPSQFDQDVLRLVALASTTASLGVRT